MIKNGITRVYSRITNRDAGHHSGFGHARRGRYISVNAKKQDIIINTLINNAGVADYGTFAHGDPGKKESILMLNVAALTKLTWLLPDIY